MVQKLLELFIKKNCKKHITQSLEFEKLINYKKNMINYMSNGKTIAILLTVELIKKILLYKMSYFRELHATKNKKRT